MELKRKLILSEDIEIVATPAPVQPEVVAEPSAVPEVQPDKPTPTDENLQYSSMINTLIKGEWDAIELYNSMTEAFKQLNQMQAVQTICDIVSEEYIHVGQLESLLQSLDVNANGIKDGQQEFVGEVNGAAEAQPTPAPEVGQFAQPEQTPAAIVVDAAPAEAQPVEQPVEEQPKQVDSEGNAF